MSVSVSVSVCVSVCVCVCVCVCVSNREIEPSAYLFGVLELKEIGAVFGSDFLG